MVTRFLNRGLDLWAGIFRMNCGELSWAGFTAAQLAAFIDLPRLFVARGAGR